MATIFTKIIQGDIPSYQIAENEYCFAFLDINPLKRGHDLVVPKIEVDYIFDLDDNFFVELQKFSKRIALALKKAIPCKRIGTAVIGLEVPHAHIHLVPIDGMKDLNFANSKMSFSDAEFSEIASAIRAEL